MNKTNQKVLFYLILGAVLSAALWFILPFDTVLIFMTGYFWNLVLIDDRIFAKVKDRKYRFSLLRFYVVINEFLLSKVLRDSYWYRVLLPIIVFGPFLIIIEQYLLILMIGLGALALEASAYLKKD